MVQRRALVAEDDAAIRRLLVRVLARSGFETEAVSNGREAIERIRVTAYDAILLDLMMPDVSGFEVLRWIRRRKPEAAQKLIVLTAASEREMRHIQPGEVCAVIRKPFDLEEVTRTVRICAGAEETADAPMISDFSPETA